MSQHLKGRVTISRSINGTPGEKEIRIEFTDQESRIRFASMHLTLENFAKAVTGQGEVEADLEVRGLDRVGWTHETKTETVPLLKLPYGDPKFLQQARIALRKLEVDGWKAREGDIENHHNYVLFSPGIKIVFFRHVDNRKVE